MSGNTFFFTWETALQIWLQAHLSPAMMSIVSQFSLFGETMLMVAILGLFYWCLDKEAGRRIGLSVILATIWCPMVKNVFCRRRPYFDHDAINIYRVVEPDADIYDVFAQGYSFPSGHSACSAANFGTIGREIKKPVTTVLAFLLPFLVGFSRVAVGAHYVTDVLAGWLLGAAAVFLIPALRKLLPNRAAFFGVLLLLTVPGMFYCRTSDYFTSMGMMFGFILSIPFEEKYVQFSGTRNPLHIFLRILGGALLYFGLNVVLKAPFSAEFLDSGSFLSCLVRCGRYALIIFALLAIYPMSFKLAEKAKAQNK